jgi:signal transduction histidine kinase
METNAYGPHLIANLDTSPYARKDPWIAAHRLKTYFGQLVRLGPEPVGSLCSFFDRDVVPSEEEQRLTGIIASAIGVEEQRRRAQKIIEDSERQLKLLSAQLLYAQETERKHIAMQLHDSIGQSLSAVKFSIEESLERLIPVVSPEKLSSLEAAVSLIQEVMRELRGMLKSLRPAMLDDLGILATIAWLCRELENIYKDIIVERHTELDEEEIPARLKIAMFRIIQEALNNAVKHSQCDRIRLELRQNGEFIELEVRDNGKGLPRNLRASDPESETGMGLSSMRERAELSGGRFFISSEPGEGMQILVSWPREG